MIATYIGIALIVGLVAGYFWGGGDEAASQARERAMVIAACRECERGNEWKCGAKEALLAPAPEEKRP